MPDWMNRIRRLAGKPSERLVRKLILLFAGLAMLIVLLLTFISYKMIERQSVESFVAGSKSNLMLVNKNIVRYFAEIDQMSTPGLQYDALIQAAECGTCDYTAQIFLENYVRSMFHSRNDIESLFFYLPSHNQYYAISKGEPGRTVRIVSDEEGRIARQKWMEMVLDRDTNRLIQTLLLDESVGYARTKDSYIAYHRVIRTLLEREPMAVLTILFSPGGRDEILRDVALAQGEQLLLADAEGRPFYWSDPAFFEQALLTEWLADIRADEDGVLDRVLGGERYMVIGDMDQTTGWTLVKWTPYRLIYASAQKTRNVSILLGSVFVLFALLAVSLMSNAITRPLKALTRKMEAFSRGNFNVMVEVRGQDEIALLSRQFNRMVRQIEELINERYRMQLAEKNAVLKALEAELNPHFMYNALQTISTNALKKGVPEVVDMVDALAGTLRYSISRRDRVLLREEIQHIERYLAIQKARFGGRLQVRFELDDRLPDVEIPKLSVQTLVENAVKHGVEKTSVPVLIRIRAWPDKLGTVIAVHDSGPGMDGEQLELLRERLARDWDDREQQGNASIGLSNLAARLKLLYGDAARLMIDSDELGTEVRILIPRGGNDGNDSGADHRG